MEAGIGIDMGGTSIKVGIAREGKLIAYTKIEASAHISLEKRLVEIGNEADRMLSENNLQASGVGLAFPGIVDNRQAKVLSKYVKYPDAQKVDIKAWALKKWGVPLVLENDARAALIGEWQYGAGRGCNDLVLITLGTGVGSAVMINGELLRGRHFLAGNLGGHMTINLNGNICNCGNIGCLETEGSTWALEGIAKRSKEYSLSALAAEKDIDFNIVFKKADEGDQLARKIKGHCLKAWSLGVINLIHAYDPERIVIGGGIMKSKGIIIPYFKEMIDKHSWISSDQVELVAAEQVEYAGVLGMYHLLTVLKNENRTT